MELLDDSKTAVVAGIIQNHHPGVLGTLLVVGCGSGIEAAILAQHFNCTVHGIDLEDRFDERARKHAQLRKGDAMALPYADSTFDFVYSYHALEHIKDPIAALCEVRRVLKQGGGYCIGTPNRRRVLGYLGSKEATLRQKIRWNLVDWKARICGKFRNEFGAHAGFAPAELGRMLKNTFSDCTNVSRLYYEQLYPAGRPVIQLLESLRCSWFVYPSVYCIGTKIDGAQLGRVTNMTNLAAERV